MSRRETAFAVATCVAYGVALVGIAGWLGVLDIARNDDWSFIENAFRFHDTGIFAVGGWVHMNLIGQLVLADPFLSVFGVSITTLHVLGIAATSVAVFATFALARTYLSLAVSVTIAVTTAVSPVVLVLSSSFMTDMFAMAGQLVALALAAMALTRDGRSGHVLWWLALMAGLWAFSIREFAITALIALAGVALIRAHWSLRMKVGTLVVAVGGVALVVAWRSTQVTETGQAIGFSTHNIGPLGALPVTMALLSFPVLLWIRPWVLVRNFTRAAWILFIAVIVLLAAAVAVAPSLILGNYFQQTLAYPNVLPGSPEAIFPRWMWWAVLAVGVVATAIVAAVVADAVTSRQLWRRNALAKGIDMEPGLALASIYSVVTLALVAATPIVVNVVLFDRYLLGLLAVAPGPIVWWARQREAARTAPVVPAVGVVGLSVLGVTSMVAAGKVDAARWELANQVATDLGIAEGNVDGGFDWFRFHTNGSPRPQEWPPRYTWWSLDDGRAVCATITFEQPPSGEAAAFPGDEVPTIGSRVVDLPFSQQVLLAKEGPDACR